MRKTTKTFNQRLLASLVLAMVMLLSAQTAWAVNYNMYIAGVQVTSDNATKLNSIDGVEGTVIYSASQNTLLLKDATITHTTLDKGDLTDCGLLTAIDGLTISVSGDCVIDCKQGCGMVLGGSHVSVTLTGSGTLTVKGTSAIQMLTTTTRLIVDGPTLVADARSSLGYGICGAAPSGTTYNGILRVNSGKVLATGGSSACSIGNLKTFALGDGMEIAKPVGAKFYEHAVTTAAGIPVTATVTIAPVPDMHEVPLTLEAIEDGTITIKNELNLLLGYAVNGGDITWENTNPIEIPVVAGQQVAFYGDNESCASYNSWTNIQCSADCYVYGNVMSLISSTGFKDLKEFTKMYGVRKLFYNNAHIKNHASKKLLLPATTLTKECYGSMFYSCNGLTEAPALPATTLANDCYSDMFRSCDGLTVAPALPATTLKEGCYRNMFYGCSLLATAPALPATTLETSCYNGMFYGCISLTTAPDLPANKLVSWCYAQMFYGCKKLNSVKCLATDITAEACKTSWLTGVSATGTFEKAAGFTGWPTGVSGIPEGWTVTEDTSKKPCGLAFTPDALTVNYGEEWVEPTLTNEDGLAVTYTSSNTAVAIVEASTGKLTLLKAGTTVITASFEGDATHYPGSASYTLTVNSKGDSPELAFDREGMVVTKGKAATAPKLTIPDGLTATYKSSSNSVATVNASTGALTIKGVGTATITATTPATLQYAAGSAVYYVMVVSNAEKIRCDANNDGSVSITDAVTVVNYILGE